MAYTAQTINVGDVISSAWGNKIEQHLERLGNYRGVVADAASLPDPATVDEGDWFLVSGARTIFVVKSGQWQRLGGVAGALQSPLKVGLFDTAGAYEGLYYADLAFTDKGLSVIEGVARITVNLGQDHKLKMTLGAESVESSPINLGSGQIIVLEMQPNVTPPAIETVQIDVLFNMSITGEVPSGVVDGANTLFNLAQYPVSPGSVSLLVDGTFTVTDDGAGNLSDGGTINYATGALTLGVAPTTSLSADYGVGQIKNETPSGTIDGTNTSFTLAFSPIVPVTVSVFADGVEYLDDGTGTLIKEITNETPSGTIDGTNTSFTLAYTPVKPGTVSLLVDGTTTVTDDGAGNLSDGGTIDYATGTIILATAPTTSLSADYIATNGTIDYQTGTLNLANAPATSLRADYEIVGGYIDLFELRWF